MYQVVVLVVLSDRLRSTTESELVQSKLYYSLELRAVFIRVVETPLHDCMRSAIANGASHSRSSTFLTCKNRPSQWQHQSISKDFHKLKRFNWYQNIYFRRGFVKDNLTGQRLIKRWVLHNNHDETTWKDSYTERGFLWNVNTTGISSRELDQYIRCIFAVHIIFILTISIVGTNYKLKQQNCKYSSHVRAKVITANKSLFVLGSLRKEGMSQEELDHLFNAIVLPNFSYALPVMVPQIPTFL